MISRSAIGQTAQRAVRRQCCAQPASRRGFAAAVSGSTSFSYEAADVNGIKVASRDVAGPTSRLAIVAKAGTRYQPAPGLTSGLEQFAFKNTNKRSALRLQRESELLGGQLLAYHTREALVLEAKFLRGDLPYFTELLGEVISQTKYTSYEYHEQVEAVIHLQQEKAHSNTAEIANDSVHRVAFRRGLGEPLIPTEASLSKYVNEETVGSFATAAYAKPNIAVVANGASQSDVSKWVGEFFGGVAAQPSFNLSTEAAKYYGGEERISHTSETNAYVIAFPGSSSFTSGPSYKPEVAVLAALLGGKSAIKYSPGFSLLAKAAASAPGVHISTTQAAYSDAGLLTINLSGSAEAIRLASVEVVKVLKSVAEGSISKEDFTKAVARAKYGSLEEAQNVEAGIVATGAGLIQGGKPFQFEEVTKTVESVTEESLKAAAKALLEGKASVAAVGDLYALPFAEELGLNV